MVCKIFFLLRIPQYFGKVPEKRKKKEKKVIVKGYAFQANVITTEWYKFVL